MLWKFMLLFGHVARLLDGHNLRDDCGWMQMDMSRRLVLKMTTAST